MGMGGQIPALSSQTHLLWVIDYEKPREAITHISLPSVLHKKSTPLQLDFIRTKHLNDRLQKLFLSLWSSMPVRLLHAKKLWPLPLIY